MFHACEEHILGAPGLTEAVHKFLS